MLVDAGGAEITSGLGSGKVPRRHSELAMKISGAARSQMPPGLLLRQTRPTAHAHLIRGLQADTRTGRLEISRIVPLP